MRNLLITVAATSLLLSAPLQAQEWKYTKTTLGEKVLHFLEFDTQFIFGCQRGNFPGTQKEPIGRIAFACQEEPVGNVVLNSFRGGVSAHACGVPHEIHEDEPFDVRVNGDAIPISGSTSFPFLGMISNSTNVRALHEKIVKNDGDFLIELERRNRPKFTLEAEFVFEKDASGTFTSGLDKAFEQMPKACRF